MGRSLDNVLVPRLASIRREEKTWESAWFIV